VCQCDVVRSCSYVRWESYTALRVVGAFECYVDLLGLGNVLDGHQQRQLCILRGQHKIDTKTQHMWMQQGRARPSFVATQPMPQYPSPVAFS